MKLKAIVALPLILLGTLALLRVVPIGSTPVSDFSAGLTLPVPELTRPHYLIPRALRTTGWPLPGGEFGFLPDPHSRRTKRTMAKVLSATGEEETLVAQAIDINSGFDGSGLQEQVIALTYQNQVFGYQVPLPELVPVTAVDQLFFVGQREGALIFYLSFAAGTRKEGHLTWTSALVELPFPGQDSPVTVTLASDSAAWSAKVTDLRQIDGKAGAGQAFCQSRSKRAYAFWTVDLGGSC